MTPDSAAKDYYLDPRVAQAYDARHAGNDAVILDDIPFYVALAQQAASRGEEVLELGCGTGRVAIPMARAGAAVTGIDSSAAMLAVARDKADALPELRLIEADMRTFDLEQRFGLVAIPFRSFQLLLTDADQEACLRRVYDHLLPGGRLALNIANPRPLQRAGGLNAAGETLSRSERALRLRYVSKDETERLLTRAGFEIEALHGWFDGRPFDDEVSSEMVWIARRLASAET